MYKDSHMVEDGCVEIEGKAMPYVVSQIDSDGGRKWRAWIPFEGQNPEDLAEIHRELRTQGFSRFCEDGQLKLFPEDREYSKVD